jgi:hypothetical protein
LAPGNDDQVVQCPNCRNAVAINEEGLSILPAQYVRAAVDSPPYWLPFWVYRAKVTILERRTQGGRSAERTAQEFWAQPRQVYIPAWACDLIEARDMVEKLLEKQPPMEAVTPPEGAAFQPAVVTPTDARKLLELVILTIEAERSDYLENFHYDLQLDSEALWLLPADREKDEWTMLLRNL